MLIPLLLSVGSLFPQQPVPDAPARGAVLQEGVAEVRQALSAADGVSIAFYDVRDVLERSLGGPEAQTADVDRVRKALGGLGETILDLELRKELGTVLDRTARQRDLLPETRELARLLRAYLQPALTADVHALDASAAGSLLLRGTAAQHAWLRDVLDRQRTTRDLVDIQSRLLTAPRGAFQVLGGAACRTFATEAELLAALAQVPEPLDRLDHPRLVCHNLQRATISSINEVAYVKEYEVRFVEPGPQQIADPIVDVIQEGVFIGARALELGSTTYGLALDTRIVELQRPIATRKIRVATVGEEVEIGVPEVRTLRFSADVRLAEGGGAVFISPLDDKKDLAFVITLRRAAAAPEPAGKAPEAPAQPR